MIHAMLLTLLVTSANAEILILKDGSVLHGTINKEDADTVEIQTQDGTLQIKKDRIDRYYTPPHDASAPLEKINYAESKSTSTRTEQTEKKPWVDWEQQSRQRIAEDAAKQRNPTRQGRTELSINYGSLASGTQIQGVSGQDDLSSPGIAFGMGFLHEVSPHFDVGFMWDVLFPSDHASQRLLANADTTTHFQAFDIMGTARLRFGSGKLRPYLLGGLGVYTAYMAIDSRPRPGFVWVDTGTNETRLAVNSDARGFASAFQAGLDYDLFEHVTIGGFLGYRYLGTATYAATDDARKLGLSGITGSYNAAIFGGQLIGRF